MSADILTRFLRQPDIDCKETNRIRDLLKLPDRNHAPIDRAFLQKPLIDRWFVDGRDLSAWATDNHSSFSENTPICFPADAFAIAVSKLSNDEDAEFLFIRCGEDISLFASLPRMPAIPVAKIKSSEFIIGNIPVVGFTQDQTLVDDIVCHFVQALLMINNHRVAATRQVIRRNEDNPADRAAMQRAMQRGAPWYSHNVVTLRRPGTAEFRGVILDSESMGAPKRQHLVAGHWRLVELHKDENGDLCPYWTWIEGHLRGSVEAGRIEKSRIVEMSAPSEVARKGYLMPSGPGAPGARMKATPAKGETAGMRVGL